MATPVACSRPDAKAFLLFLLLWPLKKLFMSKFAVRVKVVMRWEPKGEPGFLRECSKVVCSIWTPPQWSDGRVSAFGSDIPYRWFRVWTDGTEDGGGGSCISDPKASNPYTCKPHRVAPVLA
ncbi:hypothetical protein C8R44DRAFT_746277 [Mycena epipterygia]|nr:hypothetical protein C8R44DRAFT_746277 [Mycena epipterygia]